MAFGFIKKLVSKITGSKPSGQPQQKRGGNGGEAKGGEGKSRRGKRGRRGKGGENRQQQQGGNGRQQQRPQQQQEQQQGQRGGERRRDDRQQGQNGGNRRRDERRERGRRGKGRDERPRSVNTATNEMRPGGEISAEELKRRAEAHAAWDPASFAVEPVEGKKRFHDFDLPGEVMHAIADLGFRYCTDIQALSLGYALEGRNVAGKAVTGSGKTAAFLVAILTRYLRTP